MTSATYLLLACATLGMTLSCLTRLAIRDGGEVLDRLLNQPLLIYAVQSLCTCLTLSLVLWAFLQYPWYYVLVGVLLFVSAVAIAIMEILLQLPRRVRMSLRPGLDLIFLSATSALWWQNFPI